MEKLKKLFLSLNESVEKCLICNIDIRANDTLTDDGWKTLANLANTWSSVVLSIDHQYYEYMQVYELIGVRKAALCKQCRSRKYRPAFGRHSLINKLKKDNEADKPGTEAAVVSTSFPLDVPFLSGRSSATRNHSSTGNTKQFWINWYKFRTEQICFICNKIRPCDCSAYNDNELGVCEFKSAGDRLMDAANAIAETKYSRLSYRKREDMNVIK